MKETLDGRPGSFPSIRIPDKASFLLLLWAMTLTCGSVAAQSVPQSAPPPNRNIPAPAPQRHSAPSQPQSPPTGAAVPQTTRQMVGNGTIEGFVYWDTSAISHAPAGDCSGLAVNVAVAQSSTGPYTSMATLSNNFKYVGQVKQFLVGGKIKVYDVCTYGYGKVPVGQNLRVTVNITSARAFSPVSVPLNSIISPINIINAQCNMLPRIVNPTAADLFSKWGTCQNMAFDVNFEITKSAQSLSSGGTTITGLGGSSRNQSGMLSGGPQQGMLSPGTTKNATSQGNQGTLLGNRQPPAGQSGGLQSPGSKAELNPQPLPSRQGRNVISLQPSSPAPAGNVDGYVLWDTSLVQYQLSTPCQGLQVIVIDMGDNSQPTLATSNNLTPVWSTPQWNSAAGNQNFSGPTSKGPWMICHYSFRQLPEREALEVRANVTQSSAFSPQVVPAKVTGSTGTQFTIPPGNCNTRRPSSTLSTILGSFIEFCGEHAFNVNIELFPAGMGSLGSLLTNNNVLRNVTPAANAGGTMLNSSGNQTGVRIHGMKLGAPHAGPKVRNPSSNEHDANIIAVLAKQRQTADLEFSKMRTGSATLNVVSNGSASSSASNALALSPVTTSPQSTISNSPAHTESATGIASLGAANNNLKVSACKFSENTDMGIATVVGAQHGAVLSPEAQFNLYTIIGCNFGGPNSGNKAWIYGQNLHIDLQIQHWDQTAIAFIFDPQLGGLSDNDNVHLVLHRADDKELDKSGYKFYAARETVLLSKPSSPAAPVFSVIESFDPSQNQASAEEKPISSSGDQDSRSNTPSTSNYRFSSTEQNVTKADSGRQNRTVNAPSLLKLPSRKTTLTGPAGGSARNENEEAAGFDPLFSVNYASPASDLPGALGEVSRYAKINWDRPSGSMTLDNGTKVGQAKCGDPSGCLPNVEAYSGVDRFDFSKLAPGFTTDSFRLYYWQPDRNTLCGGNADSLSVGGGGSGNWDAEWDGDNIRVTWGDTHCSDTELLVGTYVKQSQYALQVWVVGPRGLDPWTGERVQTQ